MLSATVNGINVTVPHGSTVLDACQEAKVYVPTLCNHPDIPPAGKCGLCVAKVNGNQYVLSCSTKVTDKMVIDTKSTDVKDKALNAFEKFNDMSLLPSCPEIEDVMGYFFPKKTVRGRASEKTMAIEFDASKCINCDRCVRRCGTQSIGALDESSHKLAENTCISCGQCTTVCPTGSLIEKDSTPELLRAIASGKIVVLQTAPAVRVSTGEVFGDPIGTVVTGKIIDAAKKMGFKYVFDTNFGADLTIMEEGNEFIHRLSNNGVLPMFTSCCPAWINFVEKIHPEIIPHLSTAKSPHMMEGAMIKSYFAERKGIDPKNLFVVSLMPCTAKKDECQRKQSLGDVDCVVTVREYGRMIKAFGIDWSSLNNETPFDDLVAESTGAAVLFGVTGGVMEAAIRYAHEELTKTKLGSVEYSSWRGFNGIKASTTNIAGNELRIAVCNGVANAREIIESGHYKDFHFIEVMACPGGCIAGGGQPILKSRKEALLRANSIYRLDAQAKGKTSNDNSQIRELYQSFLGKPLEHKSHSLLHTHYEIQTTPYLEMMRKAEALPLIAYGTSSGTASKLASTFAGYLGTSPANLSMVTVDKMLKQKIAIIFCSTFGDGEYPSNATKFVDMMAENSGDLSSLRYAVCALGSKDYPKFCVAGHGIDKLLVAKGAQRLLPVIEIDSSSQDKGESAFEKWSAELLHSLGMKMPPIIIKPSYIFTKSESISGSRPSSKPIGYEYGVMLSSTILTPSGYQPAMHRYQIKLPVGMTYEAGDHVAILPQNDKEAVSSVITMLGLDPNQLLHVQTDLPDSLNCIPSEVTIQELFSQYLDLNGIPTRNLVRAFLQYSSNETIKERLTKLLDISQPQYFDDLLRDTNVSEFIFEFGKGGFPPLDILATAIPPIKPRLYSIASSPTALPTSLDLIITDNIFGTDNTRNGLCTSFLRRFGLTKVAIHTQQGCFGYPKDPQTPIIMAALGCGVAPMVSLLQYRESLGNKGDAALFFGCRFRNTYPILDSILENFKDVNAMQDLYVAYSRDGTTKTYITDLMEMNPDIVWKYWSNPKTEFFYCGPARGIPDQLHQILVQISMDKGNMTKDEAEAFTNAHTHHIESF